MALNVQDRQESRAPGVCGNSVAKPTPGLISWISGGTRKKGSVPDGLIIQRPLTIYTETKNFDWFHDARLEQHPKALHEDGSGVKALVALGNFEALTDNGFSNIVALRRERSPG
ncbi:hypothetical protein WMF45_45095 [Sorangium sp. So ce448]|uniref:hypothetical protein n=1 Tax=Sorangium sp. So ce448 TaxID=3133314 RepID=UPI003F5F58FA